MEHRCAVQGPVDGRGYGPDQLLCSYDGSIYGNRQAKRMAKQAGNDYIWKGANLGQPRLVKSPTEPFGAEEFAEVERALSRGLVPPH